MSINKEILVKNDKGQHSYLDLSDLRMEKLNHFKGWNCYIGQENLSISYCGNIHGSVCGSGKKLGNIFEENFKLNESPIKCPLKVCHCGSDIKIKKIKSLDSQQIISTYTNAILNDEIIEFDGNIDIRKSKTIFIDWVIAKRCNLDCEYCPSFVHDNYSPHISVEDFNQVSKNFEKLVNNGYNLKLTITGGEPTINPNYLDHIKELNEKFGSKIRVITNTNGTRTADYYSQLNKYSALFFSVHINYIDNERFIKKIKKITDLRLRKKLIDSENFFILKIMASPENISKCDQFYKKVNEGRSWWNDVQVHVEPIVAKEEGYKMLNYSEDDKLKIKSLNQHDKYYTDYMKSVMYKHAEPITSEKLSKLKAISEKLSINI